MTTTPLTAEQLAAIEARHAYYLARRSSRPCPAHPSADDVPTLLAELGRVRAELAALDDLRTRALDKNEKLRAELAAVRAILDGDDQLILCPECVCADCNGTHGQHTPGGSCTCGCDPACDRFIRDPQLGLITEAVEPITSGPLAEVIAHTTWHALTPAARPGA